MTKLLRNIVKTSTILSLVIALMLPSVLNLFHSFEHEEHRIKCENQEQVHLHEVDFTCSYIQLYATPQFYSNTLNFEFEKTHHFFKIPIISYTQVFFSKTLVNNKQKRGPPLLNS